ETNPAAYLPDLARSLNNYANHFSEVGQRQEALDPARRAVEICEGLAETNPAAYLPGLATSSYNLALHLEETGDLEGAIERAARAAQLYDQLAENLPQRFSDNQRDAHQLLDRLKAAAGQ
ncbi:MAG: tetratricopeptide repeat protein, partial [Bifidobacteriaceae bacterium]|nr:tetratricopeptide repeat protein [Bifidobacteriaceae bacterium]